MRLDVIGPELSEALKLLKKAVLDIDGRLNSLERGLEAGARGRR